MQKEKQFVFKSLFLVLTPRFFPLCTYVFLDWVFRFTFNFFFCRQKPGVGEKKT